MEFTKVRSWNSGKNTRPKLVKMTIDAIKAATAVKITTLGRAIEKFNKGRYSFCDQRVTQVSSSGSLWLASNMAHNAGDKVIATRVEDKIDTK
jgi:hypothetical protein